VISLAINASALPRIALVAWSKPPDVPICAALTMPKAIVLARRSAPGADSVVGSRHSVLVSRFHLMGDVCFGHTSFGTEGR